MAPTPKHKELALLRKLSPLNTLAEKELKQLLQETSIDYLNRGEYLFREGDTDPENVYLLSGKVALLKGKTEVETLTGDTDAARFAVAHQFPRQHAVRAKSRIEFIRINSHRLSELIENAHANAHKAEQPENTEDGDWKNLLLQSRIFQLIPRSNIHRVISRMEEVVVHADEEIILQGEEGDYFYLISEGHCSVSQKPEDSHESIEVAELIPGDCFGEDALLSDNLRSGTVTMLTDGVLMRLSKDDFINLIKHPLATTINFAEAYKTTATNGVWLDIRSPEEYQQGHMNGSINLPLNSLRFQVSSLAPGRQYIIYCQDGRFSAVAAFLLLERGFDAAILDGGMKSIPEKMLTHKKLQPEEKSAKIVELRPDIQAGSPQHKKLIMQWDEADARAQILENRLLELRKEYELKQQKLMAKMNLLEQRAKRAEEYNTSLDQQIHNLKSRKKELEVESAILLATAQEQEESNPTQLQTLHRKLKHLQRRLIIIEKEKKEALHQLEKQSKQNRGADVSSLICTPDVDEMDKVIQLQADLGDKRPQTPEQLQKKERALQTVLDNLEQQTGSTMDAVDQEVVRQEVEQLRASIKERSYEIERAVLEQRSLEDALEDRDAHLEQMNQEMDQLKVQLESVTTRYNQAEDTHRHTEEMVERLKKRPKSRQANRIATTARSGLQIKTGLFGILLGGLLCFCILNAMLVLNGKDELIYSLSGETAVQELLSDRLVQEEVEVTPSNPLDRKSMHP